jgi:hypothetical protein
MQVHLCFTVGRKGEAKMAKLGDYTPQIIDKAIDFIASSRSVNTWRISISKTVFLTIFPQIKSRCTGNGWNIIASFTGLRVFMKKRQSKPTDKPGELISEMLFSG